MDGEPPNAYFVDVISRQGFSKRFLVPLAVLALLALAACGSDSKQSSTKAAANSGSSDASGSSGAPVPAANISLVAYSTPQAAYQQLEAAFKKTAQGKGATFTESYGPSGDQSRAVVSGLKADYVAFSLAPDIDRLVKANLVAPTWNSDQYKGMVTDSVVVFVVRKGNPKNIKTWDDLVKPGVSVVTPNPFTSGGARWNIMAAYGQVIQGGGTEQDGIDYLKKLFKNVSVQDDSGRKALQTFTSGQGDVMIAYENEAIFARQNGQAIDYVVPDNTILIENPAAVTVSAPAQAKAFLDYLRTPAAQEIFAKNGYRPVVKDVKASKPFPNPPGLFTIDKFGGWNAVTKKFFDPNNSIVQGIEKDNGVATTK